ncbi:VPLPA-CTERM sorting domain-containing protein [Jannaschia seohaensis]|uniref:Secreted protein n=1 Tax=Jannaschia seohaensis TaxID=475081 RepID=A0A2Y9B5M8_9RHOB|nr:VPLPA-CTERM sorting domain-containing protein [Jannaschia seohaensis]PWJ12950.1 hypothetical protein BCF38_11586 [Jannaschia seohaensis]SSA50758.1 hypothetical protein SAMN05421539_11586 [Jannaschia seohaensis]
MKHLILGLALLAAPASAGTVAIEAYEQGGAVVFSGSGSIDITGLGPASSFTASSDDGRSQSNLVSGLPAGTHASFSTLVFPFQPLNGGSFTFDVAGDPFFFQSNGPNGNGYVSVESGYASGDPIDFTWTATRQTLSGLDLNFGTLAAFGGNTVTLSEGAPPVPLQAASWLLLAGAGVLWGLRRQRG